MAVEILILSGARKGEKLMIERREFRVGSDPGCEIYFDPEHQDQIFGWLYRSLAKNGYLVLGEAETPTIKYRGCFRKVNECCHIYQKR